MCEHDPPPASTGDRCGGVVGVGGKWVGGVWCELRVAVEGVAVYVWESDERLLGVESCR